MTRRKSARPSASANRRLLGAALLCLAASCASITDRPDGVPARYEPEEVPAALEQANEELAGGEPRMAFGRMTVARETEGLTTDVRSRVQGAFERSAVALVAQLADGGDPEDLLDLFGFDPLPRPIAVDAALAGARRFFEEGERMKAFNAIRKLDEVFPGHQRRVDAGNLISEIGFSFAEDDGTYFFFFKYRDHAPQVLEYLVTGYPTHPLCDEAYVALSELYEGWGNHQLAIERLEDLALWHADSPLTPAGRLRVARLRIDSIASPEYDLNPLVVATRELDDWLTEYETHEDRPEAEHLLRRARIGIAEHHLEVARFYDKVDRPAGIERRARLALDAARLAQDEARVEEATALLEGVGSGDASGAGAGEDGPGS